VSDHALDRIGAACGVFWFPLEVLAFILTATAHAVPNSGGIASSEEIAKVLATPPPPQAWVSEYLYTLAALLFLVFTTRLWACLWRAEGGRGWLSVTALGSGLVYVALKLPQHTAVEVLWMRAGHGLDVQVGAALWDTSQGLLFASLNFNALMAAATAVVVLRLRALPAWLGWSAAACAVALPVAVITHIFAIAFVFAFWVMATAVVLFLRAEDSAASEPVAEPAAAS
jgi:hypothetical protein